MRWSISAMLSVTSGMDHLLGTSRRAIGIPKDALTWCPLLAPCPRPLDGVETPTRQFCVLACWQGKLIDRYRFQTLLPEHDERIRAVGDPPPLGVVRRPPAPDLAAGRTQQQPPAP